MDVFADYEPGRRRTAFDAADMQTFTLAEGVIKNAAMFADDVSVDELDKSVRDDLKGLSVETAEIVGKHLAMVARSTRDAVLILDSARRIVWVNDGFVRNTGSATLRSILVAESGAPPASPLTSVSASAFNDSFPVTAACGDPLAVDGLNGALKPSSAPD